MGCLWDRLGKEGRDRVFSLFCCRISLIVFVFGFGYLVIMGKLIFCFIWVWSWIFVVMFRIGC